MLQGTVIYFNDISGTGRIRGDDGAVVLVSQKSLSLCEGYRILDEGDRVRYDVVKQKSGLEAVNLVHQ